jgi:hypothetical protein
MPHRFLHWHCLGFCRLLPYLLLQGSYQRLQVSEATLLAGTRIFQAEAPHRRHGGILISLLPECQQIGSVTRRSVKDGPSDKSVLAEP